MGAQKSQSPAAASSISATSSISANNIGTVINISDSSNAVINGDQINHSHPVVDPDVHSYTRPVNPSTPSSNVLLRRNMDSVRALDDTHVTPQKTDQKKSRRSNSIGYLVSAVKRNEEFADQNPKFTDSGDGRLFCGICSRIISNVTSTIKDHLESNIHILAGKSVKQKVLLLVFGISRIVTN